MHNRHIEREDIQLIHKTYVQWLERNTRTLHRRMLSVSGATPHLPQAPSALEYNETQYSPGPYKDMIDFHR